MGIRHGILFLLALLALLNGTRAATSDAVILQLKWKHQFQFAGYYAALEKGYYREAGLNVKIVEAAAGVDPVDQVVGGAAQYGVGTSELLLQRQSGKPVVVLGVIFQHSPLALLVRKDSGITFIHDLAGKPVMIEPQSAELLAYLKKEGLDGQKVRQVEHRFDVTALTRGDVAAMSVYVTDEPFDLARRRIPHTLFQPAAAGIDFYGDNLFTTESEIKNHPDRVKAFREASLRGWVYAMKNPEEIAALIFKRYSQRHSLDHLRFEASQMQHLMRPDLIEPGHMHEGRWRHIADTYRELGMVSGDISLSGFLHGDYARQDAAQLTSRLRYLAILLVILIAAGVYVLHLNRRLSASEKRMEAIVDTAPVALIISNAEFDIVAWNRHAESTFGWRAPDIVGRNLIDVLVPSHQRTAVAAALQDVLERNEPCSLGGENLTCNGGVITCEWRHAPFTGRKGELKIISMALDVTERSRAEKQLHHLAHTDPLTGIPNRNVFFDRLTHALALVRRRKERFALLYLDLDGFKQINDNHGHEAGDAMLKTIAKRLVALVRETDTVARMGGDEFTLILAGVGTRAEAELVIVKIREEIARPLDWGGVRFAVGASIGLALCPDDGVSSDILVQRADHAMYRAKRGQQGDETLRPG